MVRVAGGAVADFVLVFHRASPDLQRMKHKPDQAFGHREVFCFFLVIMLRRGGGDGGDGDGATYGVSFAMTRSQQLAEGWLPR
jgi:hypothetical protein